MLEYASIRFTLDCVTPTNVPTIIVAAATNQAMVAHSFFSGPNVVRNTRANAANAAALTPVDMNPVTAGGAPSYASGVHMWNGTADTLNAKPTNTRPMPMSSIGVGDTACKTI